MMIIVLLYNGVEVGVGDYGGNVDVDDVREPVKNVLADFVR